MAFQGYLIKSGQTVFPHKYMQYDTYRTTPNIREELKAVRDDNTRDLTRVTASGKKTTISFTTIGGLSLAEKKAIQKFFTDNETNHQQRKIQLTYWNDEDNDYKTGYFYRADTEFAIRRLSDDNIWYDEFDIELVEY